MSQDKPVLYALSTCIHCKNAKKLLDECDVDYDCIYVDKLEGDERKQTIQKIKDMNPSGSFPTLVLSDGKIIIGYKEKEIKEALNA